MEEAVQYTSESIVLTNRPSRRRAGRATGGDMADNSWATTSECKRLLEMARAKHRACIKCDFFDDQAEEPTVIVLSGGERCVNKEGFCHRYPPTGINEDFPNNCLNMQPWVGWHDWCGEFVESSVWEHQCEPSVHATE
jgi:hypothetical protein